MKFNWVGRKASSAFFFALIGAILWKYELSIAWAVIPSLLAGFERKGGNND